MEEGSRHSGSQRRAASAHMQSAEEEEPLPHTLNRRGAARPGIRGRVGWVLSLALVLLFTELPAPAGGQAVANQTVNTICNTFIDCSVFGHKCLASIAPYKYIAASQKVCRCEAENYAGGDCNTTTCVGGVSAPCNHHGECRYSDGSCACDTGWIGTGCTAQCPTSGGLVCSNFGTCVLSGAAGVCSCQGGRKGEACEVECLGGAANPCSGHGVCQGDGTCVCDSSYRGRDCSMACPGLMGFANRIVCSSHGTCTLSAECECDSTWRGSACSVQCPTLDGVACAGRGVCSEKGNCTCFTGMRGVSCESECAGGSQNPCNGHGECLADATCTCQHGWVGDACTIPCPGQGQPDGVCSGHGSCSADGEYSKCDCLAGAEGVFASFEGADCSLPVYHPRRLVNYTVLDRGLIVQQSQTWPAILAPAVVVACLVSFFVARLLDRVFAEQQMAEIKATRTLAAGKGRASSGRG